jgi:nitroreductase
MDLENGLRARRSIRQFLSRPVAENTLLEVLDLTRWSPSRANTQGWRIHVAAGSPLQGIKAAFGAKLAAQEERTFEIPRPHAEWPPELAARTQQLMALRTAVAAAGQRFVVGVAPGYPDLDAPINRFERARAPLSEIVTWVK